MIGGCQKPKGDLISGDAYDERNVITIPEVTGLAALPDDYSSDLTTKVKYVFEPAILNQVNGPVRFKAINKSIDDDEFANVELNNFINSGKANIKSVTTYRISNEFRSRGELVYAEILYYSDDGIGQNVRMCSVFESNNKHINYRTLGDVPIMYLPAGDKISDKFEITGMDIIGSTQIDKISYLDNYELFEYSYQQVFYLNK